MRLLLRTRQRTFILPVLVIAIVGSGAVISKVSATVTLSPDPGPIPGLIRFALEGADTQPRTPTFKAWLSGLNTPSLESVSVPAGSNTVRLRFHGIATVGWPHNNPCCGVPPQSGWVIDSNYQLESASITPITGGASNAQIGGIAFGSSSARVPLTGFNNTRGYTAQNSLDFDFYTNDPGGFKPGKYSIAFNHKYINHFSPGHYSCIRNNGQETIMQSQDFSQCRIEATQPMELEIMLANYDNKATLSRCSGQPTNVLPGQTICLVPGMYNGGAADAPQTWVELDPGGYSTDGGQLSSSQLNSYLARSGTQPTTGDSRVNGYNYDAGCMANGQCEEHYWWGRESSPAQGKSLWSVQYQPTYVRIEAATPLGTTLCFKTLVSPEGNNSAMHQSAEQCFKVGDGEITPIASCPAPALPNGNPIVDVYLPDVGPYSPAAPYLPFTTVPNDTYYQDVKPVKLDGTPGYTKVVSVNDESSGGARVSPTVVSETYQGAKINYSPYVTSYPFDTNRPSVTYDSYYNRTTYRSASSPSFYACSDGWTVEGSRCIAWYPAGSYYSCPYGGSLTLTGYGWLCATPYSYSAAPSYSTYYYCPWGQSGPYLTGYGYLCQSNGVWSGPASQGSYVSGYSCPYGGNLSGSTCYGTNYYPAAGPYYTCPYGGTVTSTGYGMLCRQDIPATALYNWTNMGTQNDRTVRNTQYNTHQMSPCYPRTYSATPTAGTATLTPDPESPNQSSFTGQITVDFGVSQQTGIDPMRQGSRINNLPYTLSYYIERVATPGSDAGSATQLNGSVTLAASNNNRNNSGNSTSVSHAISVNVPGSMQVGDQVCWNISTTSLSGFSRTNGQMDVNGNYTGGGNGQRTAGNCTVPVINAPYTRVYGGDIMAGSGFGVGCAVNTNASIIGWNRGNGAGSSVQFAAQAAGIITDFTSATGRSSGPVAPRGLSFGNTSGTYGGSFGAGHCVKDYFANATNPQPNGYTTNGTVVTPGSRQVIYVDGDAFIRGNILFAASGGAWANLDQIPSYYLVARGNIYISEQVTELNGVYIAQPTTSGSGGRIYTCVDHNTRLVMSSSPAAYDRCQNKLTVNGAFMAKQVRFLRARGSLRDSSPGEASTSSTIAEVFNFSPELFLIDPELLPQPARQYESATGLPPVL